VDERGGTRLLVVDDEPGIVELLSTALRFVGFEVRTAGSGSEALAVALSWRPDLVVLDVMLPDLDGFEVTRRLRARDGAVKNGSSFSSPRTTLASVSLVPSGMTALPSDPVTIGPSSEISTRKISASISARAKPGLAAGSADARSSMRSISFSGSNMGGL